MRGSNIAFSGKHGLVVIAPKQCKIQTFSKFGNHNILYGFKTKNVKDRYRQSSLVKKFAIVSALATMLRSAAIPKVEWIFSGFDGRHKITMTVKTLYLVGYFFAEC